MYKIKNLKQMINFQKKTLDRLNTNKKLIKLKSSLIEKSNICRFTKLFYFIYNKINSKIKKIKITNELIYNISFSFTNDSGVILYNGTIFLTKYKKNNFYSKNTNKQIKILYTDFKNNKIFSNKVQNLLATDAIDSHIVDKWFKNYTGGVSYGASFSLGVSLYTSQTEPYKITYKNNQGIYVDASSPDYYFVLPNKDLTGSCIFLANTQNISDYKIVFDKNIINVPIDYCCVGAGGGGGGSTYEVYPYNVNENEYYSGGGGGGGGGEISKDTIILPTDHELKITLGNGGIGGKNTGIKGETGTSGNQGTNTEITYLGIPSTISAKGGFGGGSGTSLNNGSGGMGSGTNNNGGNGAEKGLIGFTYKISTPSVYLASGGGGGGTSNFYFEEEFEVLYSPNGNNAGSFGGGGGGGGGVGIFKDNTGGFQGTGGYGTVSYSNYIGQNGVDGKIPQKFINNNYIPTLIPGGGGNGIFGSGGGGVGGSSSVSLRESLKTTGGKGGDGVVVLSYIYN